MAGAPVDLNTVGAVETVHNELRVRRVNVLRALHFLFHSCCVSVFIAHRLVW